MVIAEFGEGAPFVEADQRLMIRIPDRIGRLDFRAGLPIFEKSDFFNRQAEIDQALTDLRKQKKVFIHSGHRVGGTSFIQVVARQWQEEIEAGGRIIGIDFLHGIKDLDPEAFTNALAAEIESEKEKQGFTGSAPLLLVVDEMQNLRGENLKAFLKFLQDNDGDHSVMAVYKRMIYPEDQATLKAFFGEQKISLNRVSDETIREFFEERFKRKKRQKKGEAEVEGLETEESFFLQLPEPVRQWMVEQSGGIFLVAQNIGNQVYVTLRSLVRERDKVPFWKRKRKISFADFKTRVVNSLFWDNFFINQVSDRLETGELDKIMQGEEGLEEWLVNSFPRPTATIFYDWVSKIKAERVNE